MYEVKVRDIPARSLPCLLRHASNQQEVWTWARRSSACSRPSRRR